MVQQKVYLDTTVPSAYFDSRTPDRQRLTRQFWTERLPGFDRMISTVVLREIEDTPDPERREQMSELVAGIDVVEADQEVLSLAQEYMARNLFPERYASDAIHVAVAVVNGIPYFCSWNFTHLVKVATRREVNLINSLNSYGPIEIIAPPEL